MRDIKTGLAAEAGSSPIQKLCVIKKLCVFFAQCVQQLLQFFRIEHVLPIGGVSAVEGLLPTWLVFNGNHSSRSRSRFSFANHYWPNSSLLDQPC